jgi:hypothetical protein
MRKQAQTERRTGFAQPRARWSFAVAIAVTMALVSGCGSSSPGASTRSGTTQHVRTSSSSKNSFQATWNHVTDGKADVVTVDSSGGSFRLSSACMNGASTCTSTPVTLILNGSRLTICSGSPPSGCQTRDTHAANAGPQFRQAYAALPTPSVIGALYRDIKPAGNGSTLGMPTSCYSAVGKLDNSVVRYCALANGRVLATLDSSGEHWALTSFSTSVPPNAFKVTAGAP